MPPGTASVVPAAIVIGPRVRHAEVLPNASVAVFVTTMCSTQSAALFTTAEFISNVPEPEIVVTEPCEPRAN